MRKMFVVAMREYSAAVKTKAFLVSLFLMPILFGGSILVQTAFKDKVDTRDKKFAVVDYTGEIADTIIAKADERNKSDIFEKEEPGVKRKPRFLIERVAPDDREPDELSFSLSEHVRKGDLFGYLVIAKDAVASGENPKSAAISYYSNSPTYEDFRHWVTGVVNQRIQDIRLTSAHLDPQKIAELTKLVAVGNLKLVTKDASGKIKPAEATNRAATFLVPICMMMLMFMIIMVSAQPLVQSVLEEKMQRIAEVLLGSIPPFPLMMGKLIGVVGVSLTIATVYLVGGFYALQKAGYAELFPTDVVWWFVVYLALAVLMYGSLFIAIGAAVTDMKESQSLLMPVTLVVVSPMFVWLNVLQEPNAVFSTTVSLIPFATPMLMTIRQTVPPGIPIWQPILGIALVLATTVALVFAAGRIFRVGILMQGRGAKPIEMLRWIFRG